MTFPKPNNDVVILNMTFRHNMFDMLRKLGHELNGISHPYRCGRCDCYFEESKNNPRIYVNHPNEPLVSIYNDHVVTMMTFYNLNSEYDASYARGIVVKISGRTYADREYATKPYPEHYCTHLRNLL